MPGETVAAIEQDHVTLRLSREKFEQLDAYETPPESIEIEPEAASRSQRFIESFRGAFGGRARRS